MGFFEESYFTVEGREQDSFSGFQERHGAGVAIEQGAFHLSSPTPAEQKGPKSTLQGENQQNLKNEETQEQPAGVTIESLLLSCTSQQTSHEESKRHFDEVIKPAKIENVDGSEGPRSKKYRRCSSHDNLASFCEANTKEVRRISRVPSAEVLTDRGIFMHPSSYSFRVPHDRHVFKSSHKSASFELPASYKQGCERSSQKSNTNGLPPVSSHHGRSRNGEHSIEASSRNGTSLGGHFYRKSEELSKSGDKKEVSEDERKSDANSRGGIVEDSLSMSSPYYSTSAFQSATIAASELQSELKATEELLNSAARRRRYQDVWYSSAFASTGSLLNGNGSNWNPQLQQSTQLLSYAEYAPQPSVSVPSYVSQPMPDTSQLTTCATGNCPGHLVELQPSYYCEGRNKMEDTATLVKKNLQLERQMMDLHLQLDELKNENAQLRLENQQLKQQMLQK
ncbi:hypothetical protein GAYE_SCF05G2544 [Galdieria yellowstonensis]|uniref:Uncharacterized protein n=1 Tax=Galdieria yellowstonensis TaxID=3028027 RepID=A0AAV9IBD1_9RHOD|nr:hypothetical protein GAYE_SCF05G2544 [Galdieria yellowstonensis]